MRDFVPYELERISEAYAGMGDALDALKARLDSMTPQQLEWALDEYSMSSAEKRKAFEESGAIVDVLGEGSSRTAMLTSHGTVLKVAENPNGIAQNAAEAHDAAEKNSYGCFTRVLWRSRNNFAIEVERAERLEGSDLEFEGITYIPLDKFYNFLKYERMSGLSPKKRDAVYRALARNNGRPHGDDAVSDDHYEVMMEFRTPPMTAAKRVLLNLSEYLRRHRSPTDFSFSDLWSADNWGKVERDGEEVCVVVDHGATDRILNRLYRGLDSSEMHRMN